MAKLAENKRSYTLTMDRADYEKISEIAKEQRRSVAFIINDAIKKYLESKK